MFTIQKLASTSAKDVSLCALNPESEHVPEQFRCPICFEIPEKEIFQCKSGHTICSKCQKGITNCPQCRVTLRCDSKGGLIRNRALESLLDSLAISCPHLKKGCEETQTRGTYKEHAANCVYNGKCIQLCEHVGFPCNFWSKTMKPLEIAFHFRDVHKAKPVKESEVSISYASFSNTLQTIRSFGLPPATSTTATQANREGKEGVWPPILIGAHKLHFIVVTVLRNSDKSVSWLTFRLNDAVPNELSYSMRYNIESPSVDASGLDWIVPIPSILEADQLLRTPALRVPFHLLQDSYLQPDGSLKVQVSVIQTHRRGLTSVVLHSATTTPTNVVLAARDISFRA